MITVTTMRGLTDKEYTEIKTAIKNEIPFKVSVRRNRNIKSAYNTIDIRPTKANRYQFTEAQAATLLEFVQRHGMTCYGIPQNFNIYVWLQGFHYLYKIAD